MKKNRCLVSFRLKTLTLICFFILPLFSFLSYCAVITVPGDYSTIQGAIDAATDGDEIVVSPGTYTENINFGGKNLTLRSTNPTSLTVVINTVIEDAGSSATLTFSGTELTTCVLSGFTITNGSIWGSMRGNDTLATIEYNRIVNNAGNAIHKCDGIVQYNTISGNSCGLHGCDGIIQNNTISDNSNVWYTGGLVNCQGLIQNNIISGNSAPYGGGLYRCHGIIQHNIITNNTNTGTFDGYGGGLFECDAVIQHNIISGNSARYGGGLAYCHSTIHNNTISGNEATASLSSGGGLYECDGTIQNNAIHDNLANSGAGLADCDGTIQNNTIWGNVAGFQGGGLNNCDGTIQNNTIWGNSASDSGGGLAHCSDVIRNCIVWQNTASLGAQLDDNCSVPSYSCIQDWTGDGAGNISEDPRLVDPANGDFHLQPTSPCIDAGSYVAGLTEDFEGDPRPYDAVTWESRGDGSDFDIGADECTESQTAVRPAIWSLYLE